LEDKEAADPAKLRINYNFSPSVAFANGRFVLASTKELAVALATASASAIATESAAATEDASRVANSRAELRFDALRETLADNREHLIAQNMLEKGHSRAEAEQEIGVLLDIARWFDRLELHLDTTPDSMQASANLVLQSADEHDDE
jgi:acyl-CoA reductase-like NAD-dependent aldehyde dehydrogenase